MARHGSSDESLRILRETLVHIIRHDTPDFSQRQLAVFLTCYSQGGPHTFRGLAEAVGVPTSNMSALLDRLELLGLTRRSRDPRDRRNVFVQRTEKGQDLFREISEAVGRALGKGGGGKTGTGE